MAMRHLFIHQIILPRLGHNHRVDTPLLLLRHVARAGCAAAPGAPTLIPTVAVAAAAAAAVVGMQIFAGQSAPTSEISRLGRTRTAGLWGVGD